MKNKYLEGLAKSFEEGNGLWFDDVMLKHSLNINGYKYRKHRDSNGKEYGEKVWINRENEKDYITNRELTRVFNSVGYFQDKTFKTWIRNNEKGKQILCSLYVKEIDEMGSNRYCSCSCDDEYIDTSWSKVKISLHDDLISEITECANERGMDFDLYLEYVLLKQLEKERPRKRDKKIKQYLQEEIDCTEEEIAFIMLLINENGFYEEDILFYLDVFYYEYLKSKGYTEQQLNFVFTEEELPQVHYKCKSEDNTKSFEDIQNELKHTEFEVDKKYERVDLCLGAINKKFLLVVQKAVAKLLEYIDDKRREINESKSNKR